MKHIPKSILIILAVVFLSHSLIGQLTQADTINKIDSIITHYMTAHEMVGVSIGIVRNGQIYLTRGYGTAEIGKVKPIDSLTNFLTCSVSKLFTATAIMQLSEQNKIDISENLVFYLPDFKMKDERYQDITIEHMLTHSSGLSWDEELKHSPNDSSALEKLVYSLDRGLLDFAPGTKFNALQTYSNAAYDILGYLVQKISGKLYEDYVKENILIKAHMVNSAFNSAHIPAERRSSPHILKGKLVKTGGMYDENREHSPSANLNSCSLDMCRWMMNTLNIYHHPSSFNGVLQNNTLLNMWTTRHVAPQNKNVSIGLGWWITHSDDLGKYYWHVGGNPGFSATLIVLPEHNFGITVLSNGMYAQQVVWNKIPFDIINLFKAEWKRQG